VTPGSNVVVFGLGGIGLNVIQGARMVGADKIVGVDVNDSKEEWGRRFGMTHFVNPKKVEGDIVQHLVGSFKTSAGSATSVSRGRRTRRRSSAPMRPCSGRW
jgi:Zn-dependent alcohol dehydrogenase